MGRVTYIIRTLLLSPDRVCFKCDIVAHCVYGQNRWRIFEKWRFGCMLLWMQLCETKNANGFVSYSWRQLRSFWMLLYLLNPVPLQHQNALVLMTAVVEAMLCLITESNWCVGWPFGCFTAFYERIDLCVWNLCDGGADRAGVVCDWQGHFLPVELCVLGDVPVVDVGDHTEHLIHHDFKVEWASHVLCHFMSFVRIYSSKHKVIEEVADCCGLTFPSGTKALLHRWDPTTWNDLKPKVIY